MPTGNDIWGSASPTWVSNGAQGLITWGMYFQPSAAYTARSIGFWKRADTAVPQKLSLWRVSDQVKLFEKLSPVAQGNDQWNWYDLDTPIDLVSGTGYMVAGVWAAPDAAARTSGSSPSPQPTNPPMSAVRPAPYYYRLSDGFPDQAGISAVYLSLNVTDQGQGPINGTVPTAPSGSGPGTPTVNDLKWWLHKDTTNPDSIPKLMWADLGTLMGRIGTFSQAAGQTLKDNVDAILTILGNIPKRGDSEWTVAQKLWRITDALSSIQITDWNTFAQRAPSQLTGASGGGGSAFYGPNGTQVADGVEYLIEHAGDGTLFEKLREQLQLTPSPATDPRWHNEATVTGTGPGVVTTGADLYRLSVTLGAGSRPGVSFGAGLDWHRYLGWVAPVRDGYVTERRKLEWLQSEWRYPPHFLHGLVISLGPGDDWSCECWQLDR